MKPLGTLSGADVARALGAYRHVLRLHQDAINRLNVYPVPDGDTGTNMALTVESVVTEIGSLEGVCDLTGSEFGPGVPAMVENGRPEMTAVCRAIAHGSLMGARGNSGVILSQLLRGCTGVLAASAEVGAGRGGPGPGGGQRCGARQAVLRPVEGTILTVARAVAGGAEGGHGHRGEAHRGPRAGPGGGGRGAREDPGAAAGAGPGGGGRRRGSGVPAPARRAAHRGGRPGVARGPGTRSRHPLGPDPGGAGGRGEGGEDSAGEGGSGAETLRYEVMYLLDAPDETMPAFKEVWAGIGDSIVVVGGEGLWNCHIHTNDVGASIEAGLDAGRPRNIRVTDLVEQMEEERWVRDAVAAPGGSGGDEQAGPPSRTAVVAVANGEGVGRIFRSLGVHHLVAGGQSMNPSTAQILEVVEGVPSSEVVILPNNDNIRPVAMQVCELASKTVRVVPTSGIVEGFAALLEYDPEAGADDNAAAMAASARRVVAGEVTQAVRDATGPMGPIRMGDWIGLSRDGVEVVGETMGEAASGLLGKLLCDEHELVTLIEGEGAKVADTRQITEWLAEHRPDIAVEVHHGGQPLYPYLISIE